MKLNRTLLSIIMCSLVSLSAFAFDPTTKPVKVIIPYSPGGTIDRFFRDIQQYASAKDIVMIPEYKLGASGVVGLKELQERAPDGHSLSVALLEVAARYTIMTKESIDPKNVMFLNKSNFGYMVKSSSRFSSWKDVVAELKRTDIKGVSIGYATPLQRVEIQALLEQIGPNNAILVDYGRSGLTVLTDLMSESLDVAMGALATYDKLIDTGKLTLVAVSSEQPIEKYAAVPTLKSLYPNMRNLGTRGSVVLIANNTPKEIVDYWRTFITEYKKSPTFIEKAKADYYEILTVGPAEIQTTINSNARTLESIK